MRNYKSQQEAVKEIPLRNGDSAVVDEEYFEELNKLKWRAHKCGDHVYVCCTLTSYDDKKYTLRMHRLICGLGHHDKMVVDHINHDTLNNSKKNLRISTSSQNVFNTRVVKSNSSGFRGVSWAPHLKKWRACVNKNGVRHACGCFKKKEDALKARLEKAKELYGDIIHKEFIDGAFKKIRESRAVHS